LAATASARKRPLAISPATLFRPKAVKSTSPLATATNSDAASLKGTCSICSCAARGLEQLRQVAKARAAADPQQEGGAKQQREWQQLARRPFIATAMR
jgi:hypothetical protein